MKRTRDEAIKGCFTKYVETALKRARKDYVNKNQKRQKIEETVEPGRLSVQESDEAVWDEAFLQSALDILWESEPIRRYLDSQIDKRMQEHLLMLTDDEVIIVFAKVFRELTFKEIGDHLGWKWKKVAWMYSYARKKLMKGWNANEI